MAKKVATLRKKARAMSAKITGRKAKKRSARKAVRAKSAKMTTGRTKRIAGSPAKSAPAARAGGSRLPKPSSKAELIVREGFVIDATSGGQQATSEVLILGNREGFRYLSDAFAHLAEQAGTRSKSTEPAEPVHLSRLEHPVNVRLSDALEFRFAPLTAANRAATFKRYGITMKSREHGSLFGRYREVAETEYQKVARRIRERRSGARRQ